MTNFFQFKGATTLRKDFLKISFSEGGSNIKKRFFKNKFF